METRYPFMAGHRSYEDFDPLCKWSREEGRDILEVHLPGFRREQVKVQVNHLGFLIISGERSLMDGARWRRFKKEIEIPTHCNVNAINARFMQNILTVVIPKQVINPVSQTDKERQTPEYEPPRKEKETADPKMEFTERNRTRHEETVKEDTDEAENEFEGETDAKLTPESTREVALKAFVVVVLVLLLASYVTDVCKSMVADSYFLS
ncbi:inactive protein RESTRICTED TEV MOVEMENT 2-like [Prosopis cineraria]|uniref:inactive protein RESTRICTED TEV MOVEMENT 2-like n=1 Tax=Prosopis cineraria TaxID=364024 RepID=UPI00240F04CB|nr:inactive protein RESTRICTED TEV MOVEMENT 2-like [Prosopis cineraria]